MKVELGGSRRPIDSSRRPAIPAPDTLLSVREAATTLTLPTLSESSLTQVAITPPTDLDKVEAIRCYQSIEQMLGSRSRLIVQLASPTASSANSDYAHAIAWAGAVLLGRRVLLIHIEPPQAASMSPEKPGRKKGPSHANLCERWPVVKHMSKMKTLSDMAATDTRAEEFIIKEASSRLYLWMIEFDKIADSSGVGANAINSLLNGLRPHFDMIVIAPPSVADRASATILSGFVDGTVLVMQALQSRRRSVQRAINALQSGGAPILGIIFSGEQNYLPKWLRWLQPG